VHARLTRLPILIAWILVLGVVVYLGTHPRLVAPFASRLISRNLLQDLGGTVRVDEYRFRALRGVDVYGVSATFPGRNGDLTIVSIDTLSIDYRLKELLGRSRRLRQAVVKNAQIFIHLADRQEKAVSRELDLPWLSIDLLRIEDSSLSVSGPDGRLRENIPTLNWRGEVRSGANLQLTCRNADIDWASRHSRLSRLHGDLVFDGEGVRTPELGGQFNDKDVDLVGGRRWDGTLDLRISGRDVVTAEVEDLLDMTLGFVAEGDLDASFATSGENLLFDGTFDGVLEGYRMEQVHGQATFAPERVHFSSLVGRVNEAWFSGTADFDIRDPEAVNFTLDGEVADVDLSRDLVPEEEDLPQTAGGGHLTIYHGENPLVTRVTGELHDGRIEMIPFDTCLVDVTARAQQLVFDRIDLRYAGLRAQLTGAADSNRFFAGELAVEVSDLTTLPPQWGWPAVAGRLQGSGTVTGPEDRLDFAGAMTLHDFALDPLEARYSDVVLAVGDMLNEPTVAARVEGRGFALGGVPLGRHFVVGSASRSGARVDSFRTTLGDSTIVFRGQAAFTDSLTDFRVADFWIDLEGNRWTMSEPAEFHAGEGAFVLPGVHLESASGTLDLVGALERDGVLYGSLQLRRFELGLLNPFLPAGSALTGETTASARLAGTVDAPEISLTADVSDCHFDLAQIHALHVAGDYGRGRVTVDTLRVETNHGVARASGSIENRGVPLTEFWPGATLALELDVEKGDWAFVDQFQLPALERIAGEFTAQLRVAGATDDPLLTGAMVSEPFHIHWLHLDRMSGHVRVDTDQLVLSGLVGNQDDFELAGRVEVPLRFDLLSEPVSPEDGPFYMRLTVPEGTDLAPLSEATNAFVETSGRGWGDVVISGPAIHPFYQGTVSIENGRFILRGLEEIYHDCHATGEFSGDVLTLDDIRGREGLRGSFAGRGEVRFAGLLLENFALDLALDRFLVASIPDFRVLVKTDQARMTGRKVGPDSLLVPAFSGELEVIKARYTGDFSEKPGAIDPRMGTVAPDWLADVHVVAPSRSVWLANRTMELEIGGDVNLVRDLDGMYLRGSLNIDAGRIPVFNNDFKVVRGNLDFSREVGLEPRVDLDAETQVRVKTRYMGDSIVERIMVNISGSVYEPETTFSSESGFNREGIERMLLGLSPYADQEGMVGRLTNSSIRAGFNLLEREIAGSVPFLDTIEIDQIQREQVDGAMGLDPLVGVGKYVLQDLYIKYATWLSQEDRDILVEYQISDHLLLQSAIRRRLDEYNGEDAYNLDLKYRHEY